METQFSRRHPNTEPKLAHPHSEDCRCDGLIFNLAAVRALATVLINRERAQWRIPKAGDKRRTKTAHRKQGIDEIGYKEAGSNAGKDVASIKTKIVIRTITRVHELNASM